MTASLGRIVHFVESAAHRRGEERAAIIHGVHGQEGLVDLTFFGPNYSSPQCVLEVPYSEDRTPGSWHWPEKV